MLKKYAFTTGFIFAVLGCFLVLAHPKKAQAAFATSAPQINGATFQFISRDTIVGTFPDPGGFTENFVDSNPFDNNQQYKPIDGDFCDVGTKGGILFGVAGSDSIALDKIRSLSVVRASVDLDFKLNNSVTDCTALGNAGVRSFVTISNPSLAYGFVVKNGTNYQWIAEQSNPLTFQPTSTVTPNFYKTDLSSACPAGVLILGGGGTTGQYYALSTGVSRGGGPDASLYGALKPYFSSGVCSVVGINGAKYVDRNQEAIALFTAAENQKFYILPAMPSGVTIPAGTVAGSAAQQGASCTTISRNPLNWILCPVINGLDELAKTLQNSVEGLLIFNVGSNGSSGDFGQKNEVKQAWSVFKNLATVILVLIMLLIVLSEALGWGVFDAYAVRKMLPRLIIAAISIQLSWAIFSWLVTLANDAGTGLSDLMFLPFGGKESSAFDLNTALTSTGVGGEIAGGVALIGAGIAVAVLNIFGMAAIMVSVVATILMAFFILILRKVLIILCLITVPIALICWILPGTQKYWKLWHETFSKLLLMFPLFMAVFAAGKIFAKITTENPTLSGFQVINFFIVLVGFFGPYWILPKSFQWGGKFLGQLSGAVNNRQKGVFDRSRNFLKGRQKLKSQYKREDSAESYAANEYKGWKGAIGSRRDKLRLGKYDPTYRVAGGQTGVERHEAQVIQEARKANRDALDAASTVLDQKLVGKNREESIELINKELYAPGASQTITSASIQRLAALKAGDDLENIRDHLSRSKRTSEWKSAISANYDKFKAVSPHLTAQDYDESSGQWSDGKTFEQATAADLSQMSGLGWKRFTQLNPKLAEAKYNEIRESPNLRGNLAPSASIDIIKGNLTKLGGSPAERTATAKNMSESAITEFIQAHLYDPDKNTFKEVRLGKDGKQEKISPYESISSQDLEVLSTSDNPNISIQVKEAIGEEIKYRSGKPRPRIIMGE